MARTKEFDEQAVLEKARDLFWERGYTATSIRDLEEYLGISRSSIYLAFGGKRELYDRTLAMYREESMLGLERNLTEAEDLRQALIELFTATARQSHPECKSKARGCYVVNATTEMANSCSKALGFAAESREQFVAIMQAALARAQVRGKLEKQADLTELADYLFVCYNGLQVVVQTNIERGALVKAVVRSVEGVPWR
ncbi:MAG: TetR/AcrR family transcriptional regulator [Lewinella sp.]